MGKGAFQGMPPSNFSRLPACTDCKPRAPGRPSLIVASRTLVHGGLGIAVRLWQKERKKQPS